MTQMADLVFHGGQIVSDSDVVEASLAVQGGKVAALGPAEFMPEARETVDAKGKYILPGIIDPHVHFREPGMAHKEDWASGSRAAAVGGVTTVFEMPNTNPPTDSADAMRAKAEIAGQKSIIDFGLYGLLGEHNLDHLEPLAKAGAIGFKLFLGNTTGSLSCPNDGAVLEGFEILAELGLRCSVHAESAPMVAWRERKIQEARRNDPFAHLAARTDIVALEALNRACLLAEWTGARIHIVHESCARSLEFIRFWKSRDVDMTVETLPQYLYLAAEEMIEPGGEVMRMNPPIRERQQQQHLWDGLKSGLIDMIATDHAPHTPAEKSGNRIWDIACGFAGVQHAVPLMLTAVANGEIDIADYVRMSAVAPSIAFGIYGKKGVLRPGSDADIVLIDPLSRGTIKAEDMFSLGKITPFAGFEYLGAPVATYVRGRLVAKDGQPAIDEAWGEQVTPSMPPADPQNTNTTMKAVLEPNNRPF